MTYKELKKAVFYSSTKPELLAKILSELVEIEDEQIPDDSSEEPVNPDNGGE